MTRAAPSTPRGEGGFTLVEVIVAIIIAAVLGTLMVQFMGSTLTRANVPVQNVQEEMDRVSVMEKIMSDYVVQMNTDPAGALTTMKAAADGGGYDTAASTVTMTYIAFDGTGGETGPTLNDTLKVTVATDNATLVTILTNSRTAATDPKIVY